MVIIWKLTESPDLFSVFKLVAGMNRISIFALLPVGGIFLALTIFKLEYVNIELVLNDVFVFKSLLWWFQSTINASSIAYAIVCIGCSLVWPYLFCNYSSLVTDRTTFIGTVAYNMNWIDFPLKLQKNIVLIIRSSQDRVQFTGLNLVNCSLEVFGNVRVLFMFLQILFMILLSI